MRVVAGIIPIKTAQGQAELSGRERRVSQRHRTILFLVDGKRPVAEIQRMAAQAGVPAQCFADLVELGLIALTEPTQPLSIDPGLAQSVFHVDLPLQDSELPPSRTLYPSVAADSSQLESLTPANWPPSEDGAELPLDPSVSEARAILIRAVRAEAPLTGSLTLLRLRRARTRGDLSALLDEVESRITKPHRRLATAQTLKRVRLLLDGRLDPSLEPV